MKIIHSYYRQLKDKLYIAFISIHPKKISERNSFLRTILNGISNANLSGKFSDENEAWQNIFRMMIDEKSLSVSTIQLLYSGFAEEKLSLIKEAKTIKDFTSPVVVCTQKDNYVYLKKFLPYYRGLGVKHFVFIDNNSTDESYQYLLDQEDVTLFSAPYSFQGTKKAGWKLQALSYVGLNHWYLWLDSDEFLAYPQMESVKLDEYISYLSEHNIQNVGGFMLDMYPDYKLFEEDENPNNFYEDYVYFDPDSDYYHLEKGYLFGGMRGRCLDIYNLRLDKTPIIYCSETNIPCGNHSTVPSRKRLFKNYGCVLKHYKFLSSDKDKYKEIAKPNSGYNSTKVLSKYMDLADMSVKDANSVKFIDSTSLSAFPYIKNMLSK